MIRRAVIDVGTNSVKVLLAQVSGREVLPEWETSEQTRLGRGFYEDHRLRPEPIAATAAAVARYASEARDRGAASVRVIATSAAREAVNASELLDAIRAASGRETEVIPGSQEADLGFAGVTSDPALAEEPLLVLDVGGGSTEFILGDNGRARFSGSFQLGSVRLLETLKPSDAPTRQELQSARRWLLEFLEQNVRPKLVPHLFLGRMPDLAVGVGGTTTILAQIKHGARDFDRARIESTRFAAAELRALNELLWSLPLAELPNRAAEVVPDRKARVATYCGGFT